MLKTKKKTAGNTEVKEMTAYGSLSYKMSFLIMGWANIAKKQFAKVQFFWVQRLYFYGGWHPRAIKVSGIF